MNWQNSWNDTKPTNPEPSAFPEWDSKDRDAVLLEWQRLKDQLAKLKEIELEFRKYVVKRNFPNPDEGTNSLELGNGYTLKAGIKFNYKLADNDTVEKGLEDIAKIGNQGAFIADRLISWTPNFLLTEYRQLQEEADKGSADAKAILNIIATFLTIDDKAAPTLEIKEPKGKKK